MNYTFFSPQQIVFGWGRRSELPQLAAELGRRVFLVSGSRTLERRGVIDAIESSLKTAGLTVLRFAAPSHEPEVADVDRMTAEFLLHQPGDGDVVLGIGGGSALDLAKAAAAMATNCRPSPECAMPTALGGHAAQHRLNMPTQSRGHATQVSVRDFLEGVGRGLKIERPPLPMIAVPTTAGTGSEATKNAVISSYDPPFKKSLRSDRMVPRCVVVDPELTVSLPPQITAYTGMDAITQLIESYISKRSAPIPRALCEQGLELALISIRQAVQDGNDRPAREAMSQAACLSGLALANSGLGLAHGVAAALGVHCRVAHGLACAVMLPAALKFNRSVREADLARLARRCLSGNWPSDATAATALIDEIQSLCREVGIPSRLRDLGVNRVQIFELVTSSHGNSLSGNPREISDTELRELLEALW
jgi:alcohol dehydrogenase class IV